MASRCQVCSTRHTPRCRSTALTLTWPLAPLIDTMGGPAALCRRLGWHGAKGLPETVGDSQADAMAIKCGLHPELVWPGWCEAGLTERDHRFIHQGGWRPAWLHNEATRQAAA